MRPALLLALLALASTAQAWSACGHHVVALIAYDRLDDDEQQRLRNLLAAHPRFAEDFTPPPGVRDAERYQVGLAGYWPDVARGGPYDRPDWHWQLAATKVIGETEAPPKDLPPLPTGANLDTRNLTASQAIELCRLVMADPEKPAADRSLALCWLAHLVGDVHQPCHAGSLYVEGLFPKGDRGANEIPTDQGGNLHSLWDGLLGRRFDEGDVRRRRQEIVSDVRFINKAREAMDGDDALDPERWLRRSREFSAAFVYTNEVLGPVRAASDGKTEELPTISLSPEYLEHAGTVARIRVVQAGYRLADVWREGLAAPVDYESAFADLAASPAPVRQLPKAAKKVQVWVTDTGEKYHRAGCRYCKKSGKPIDLDAVRGHMEPCKVCRPPR